VDVHCTYAGVHLKDVYHMRVSHKCVPHGRASYRHACHGDTLHGHAPHRRASHGHISRKRVPYRRHFIYESSLLAGHGWRGSFASTPRMFKASWLGVTRPSDCWSPLERALRSAEKTALTAEVPKLKQQRGI